MEEKNEVIISAKLIVEVIRKNLIFIIIAAVVFGSAAFVYNKFFVAKRYATTFSVYVETKIDTVDPTSSNSIGGLINMQNYATKLVNTYIRLLDTSTCYKRLSAALDGKYSPDMLKSMITYTTDEKTQVFDINVTAGSPEEALEIAQSYCTVAPQVISDLNANTTLKVADEPELPTDPVYPKAGRSAVIAALIGVVLMLIVAFVRHFMDKNIRYNDEMTEIYGIPILAAIPNFDRYLGQKSTAQKNAAARSSESKTTS